MGRRAAALQYQLLRARSVYLATSLSGGRNQLGAVDAGAAHLCLPTLDDRLGGLYPRLIILVLDEGDLATRSSDGVASDLLNLVPYVSELGGEPRAGMRVDDLAKVVVEALVRPLAHRQDEHRRIEAAMACKLGDVAHLGRELQGWEDLVREDRAVNGALLELLENLRRRDQLRLGAHAAQGFAEHDRGNAQDTAGCVVGPEHRLVAVQDDAAGMAPHREHMHVRRILARIRLIELVERRAGRARPRRGDPGQLEHLQAREPPRRVAGDSPHDVDLVRLDLRDQLRRFAAELHLPRHLDAEPSLRCLSDPLSPRQEDIPMLRRALGQQMVEPEHTRLGARCRQRPQREESGQPGCARPTERPR